MVRKVIGSNTTNASGISTITYKPTELGELKIYAQSGELISEAYPVYSVSIKDLAGETNWTGSAYMDRDVSSGEYVQLSSNAANQSTYYINIPSDSTVVEFDIMGSCPSDETLSSMVRFANGSSNNGTFYQSNINLETDRWYHIKLVSDNANMKYHMYLDGSDEIHYSITKIAEHNRFYFLINANLNTIIKYKNFIVY